MVRHSGRALAGEDHRITGALQPPLKGVAGRARVGNSHRRRTLGLTPRFDGDGGPRVSGPRVRSRRRGASLGGRRPTVPRKVRLLRQGRGSGPAQPIPDLRGAAHPDRIRGLWPTRGSQDHRGHHGSMRHIPQSGRLQGHPPATPSMARLRRGGRNLAATGVGCTPRSLASAAASLRPVDTGPGTRGVPTAHRLERRHGLDPGAGAFRPPSRAIRLRADQATLTARSPGSIQPPPRPRHSRRGRRPRAPACSSAAPPVPPRGRRRGPRSEAHRAGPGQALAAHEKQRPGLPTPFEAQGVAADQRDPPAEEHVAGADPANAAIRKPHERGAPVLHLQHADERGMV